MAESERDFAALQALLADNTTQNISAQDIRDLMISVLGGYASIYVDGGAVAQSLTATPAKLTGFTAAGPARGAAGSHADDELTASVAGDYLVEYGLDATATVAADLDVELYVGGVQSPGFSLRLAVGSSPVRASCSGILTLAAGAVLELRGSVSADSDVTPRNAQFSLKRVG